MVWVALAVAVVVSYSKIVNISGLAIIIANTVRKKIGTQVGLFIRIYNYPDTNNYRSNFTKYN
jgi:hypothetical protein